MTVTAKEAAAFLDAREQAETSRRHARFLEATKDFSRMVAHVVKNYPNVRIYQWGSLLDGSRFDENSDIDMAVEGLDHPADFFRLQGDLSRMTDFPVDLVELDKIDPAHRDSILKKGKCIHAPS